MTTTTTKTINKENLKKVIDALRSGQYQKGRGALEYVDNNGVTRNCCLGVATRVFMAENPQVAVTTGISDTTTHNGFQKVSFSDEEDFLPSVVQNWLELNEFDLTVVDSKESDKNGFLSYTLATEMNDATHFDTETGNELEEIYTFEDIAHGLELYYGIE